MGKMAPSIVKGEYKKIPEHYNRDNWVNKRYWSRVTKPYVRRKATLPGNIAVDPYTGEKFKPKIGHGEHVTSLKEAHESQYEGNMLTPAQKKLFAHNRANLVLSLPKVNIEKGVHDIANWQPKKNIVPMAKNIVRTKKRFGLAADLKEYEVLTDILGDKPDLKVKPKLSNTSYCTRCHVTHSILDSHTK